ncbi:MAG: PQQ-dependent sugar dehydrogenase [Ignavibacteria bacterium]|nr:PQQ-dependent sugar dehydrogenase [Ignavibacteria bacterium]
MTRLYKFILILMFSACVVSTAQTQYTFVPVASGLTIPWEIEFGADGALWCSERIGLMSRIDVATGSKSVVLDLRSKLYTSLEVGMLGFAFHPQFADSPYVFLAYTAGNKGHFYRVVERYTFDGSILYNPVEIFRHDPADEFHQGCRLVITQDLKIFITNGDAPYAPYDITGDSVSNTKIIRVNLDGSIPEDNPDPRYRMWSRGHRNVQGLTITPKGKIWSSEHGNAIDDELNLVQPGVNYGWPFIEGYCDQPYEKVFCDSLNLREPVWSSGGTTCAPSGLAYYNHPRFPEFQNSLLLTTLKASTLYVFSLNDSTDAITNVSEFLSRSIGRLRDIAIHPDGRIFVCTSNREPNGYPPFPLADDDKICELIALPDSARPIPVFPDSVHVKAWVNDELRFTIDIRNDGDAPFVISNAYGKSSTSPINNAHWRTPFTVLPGVTYPSDAVFAPPEEGRFENEIWYDVRGFGVHTLKVVGSTDIGVLTADSTNIQTGCYSDDSVEVVVPFKNIGSDSINITSTFLSGRDASRFNILLAPTGLVGAGERVNFIVQYVPKFAGIHQCTLNIVTDSYRPTFSTIVGLSLLSSVDDYENSNPKYFVATPNPFTASVSFSFTSSLGPSELVVSNVLGEVVWRTNTDGVSAVEWSGVTSAGVQAAPGMYVTTLNSASGSVSIPIMRRGE